MARPTGVGAR